MCHVCVGVRRAYRTSWAEMGGACFADEKPDADGGSLGTRARRWVGSGLARVWNNYSIPRVEISLSQGIYIDTHTMRLKCKHLLYQMHGPSTGHAYMLVHPHACKIRWNEPTTPQPRHPPGSTHAENLLLIRIGKMQYLLNRSSDFRSICIRSFEKTCLTK